MPRVSRTAALLMSIRSRACAPSPSLATTFSPCSLSQHVASLSSIYRRYQMSIPFTCAPSCPYLQVRIRHALLLYALLLYALLLCASLLCCHRLQPHTAPADKTVGIFVAIFLFVITAFGLAGQVNFSSTAARCFCFDEDNNSCETLTPQLL